MTATEFSRPVRADTLGETPRHMAIEADESERKALARRFALEAVEELAAEAALIRTGSEVRARGRLRAKAVQRCIATGKKIEAWVDEPFDIRFRPTPDLDRPDEEIELEAAELDVVFYDGAAIDIGDAVAETLALSLDPYPRTAGAERALKAAGVKSEEEAGPFAALAALRDKLGK